MRLELHERQSAAFESPATELLYGGQAGGGKSHLLRVAAIAWCVAIPGLQVYIFRRTSPDLLKNHMEGPTGFPALLAEWTGNGWASINYSKSYIDLPGGSRIHLCHCQYEKDVYNYQGAEIHVLMVDELTHFSSAQYRYLRSRLRTPDALEIPPEYQGRFPRCVAASNPGGVGHNWVKAAWITEPAPAPMEIWQAPDSDGGMTRQFVPAALVDNPSHDGELYAKKLMGLHRPELVQAMLHGNWDIESGGMFEDVWDEALHFIEPFDIPGSWRVDRSFDWGSSRPFSVGWWAESDGTDATLRDGTVRRWPKGTLFRIAEWYGWNGQPDEGVRMLTGEIARGILDRERSVPWGGRVRPGPAGTDIFDTENGTRYADEMALVGVRWERAYTAPHSRKPGAQAIRKRLKAAEPLREGMPMEEPGLFIFANCRHWKRTVVTIPRDERDPDDVNSKAEDHAYDETRYRVFTAKQEITHSRIGI